MLINNKTLCLFWSNWLLHLFFSDVGSLPHPIFARNCYPSHAVRINAYSKPKYLIDILQILEGMPELDRLLESPLGSLFSLPVRHCSLSGQLVHQMLCRQLNTTNSDEMWFVFGGHPLRFSLVEFHQLTGLACGPFPPASEIIAATTHSSGHSPFWYKVIGDTPGCVTIKELVSRLKREPQMPLWRKFRICLVVLVEGVILCRGQPVRPSVEVVEMVKNVEFFLNYPWGRHSFQRILRTVRVGSYISDTQSLISKLRQSSLAVHGFPLAIQLLAFKHIPLLLRLLPNGDELHTFLSRTVIRLRKCKSFHVSNILAVEYDPKVCCLRF